MQASLLSFSDIEKNKRTSLDDAEKEARDAATSRFVASDLPRFIKTLDQAPSLSQKFSHTLRIAPTLQAYAMEIANAQPVGSPSLGLRFFLGATEVPEALTEIFHAVFKDGAQNIQQRLNPYAPPHPALYDDQQSSNLSPSEVLCELFLEALKGSFLAELNPSLEERFFDGAAVTMKEDSLFLQSLWDNYRHRIHGFAKGTYANKAAFHHVVLLDAIDVGAIISDFDAHGVRNIPSRALLVMNTPEVTLTERRKQRVRRVLNSVAQRYQKLSNQPQAIDISSLWKLNAAQRERLGNSFIEKREHDLRKRSTSPAVGSVKKIGWRERIRYPNSKSLYRAAREKALSGTELAQAVHIICNAPPKELTDTLAQQAKDKNNRTEAVLSCVSDCIFLNSPEKEKLSVGSHEENHRALSEAIITFRNSPRVQEVEAKISGEEYQSYGLTYSSSVRGRFISSILSFFYDRGDQIPFLSDDVILGVLSICTIEDYISSRPTFEQDAFIREVLQRTLGDTLSKAGIPVSDQEQLFQKISSEILGVPVERDHPTWVEKQDRGKYTPKLPERGDVMLWTERHKELGQEPPDFLKENYATWLRSDVPHEMRLTRGLLNYLDPSLYKALTRWEKKPGNNLPDDICFGSKQITTEDEVRRFNEGDRPKNPRDYARLANASARARERSR